MKKDEAGGKLVEQKENIENKRRSRSMAVLLLCLAGVLVNIAGAQLALALRLPVFLDSVGTVAAAVLGGYLPGVLVGFLTNLFNGIRDYTTVYYNSISVLIALFASWAAKHGWLRKPGRIAATVLVLVLIGGGLGSVLTWNLYGGGIGEGIAAPLAHAFYDSGRLGMFAAQLGADLLIDLADKTITVLLVLLLLRLLPEALKGLLSTDRRDTLAGAAAPRLISLRAKVLVLISAAAFLVTVAVTGICLSLYNDAIVQEESKMAYGVANTAMNCFDPDRVDEYIALGEAAPGYTESESRLAAIAASTEDIEYVYVYKILEDGCHVVFDPDTEETEGGDPGEVIPFDESFFPLVPALLAGEPIEPLISDDTFGWLLTIYLPVKDSSGKTACYVGVDISMRSLSATRNIFLARVISLFFGFFILILAVGAWEADRGVIRPINAMAAATSEFASNSEDARQYSVQRINELDVRTGDEIENLYHAIQTTTSDVVRYIADVQAKSRQIAQMQNGLILVLAEMVESRDKCTGNHVRNTALYAEMIMRQMQKDGTYSDVLTDDFVYDVVSSAPLHDIGKVKISDTLLNKPGRLTDEEFMQMKDHTVVGGEIIDRAINMMAGSMGDYLTEARNLTLYHHERWDGKGYPEGLKGEEIPVSARIMAVADVFDALIAKRSYKEGFPFEKAIDIITSESGTHFDPVVVDAFLKCKEEARRVSREANEKIAQEMSQEGK